MTYLRTPPPLGDTIEFDWYYGVSSPWAFLGAKEAERIAKQYGLTINLKPITVHEENGGIRLKDRHPARQAYHALDLNRWSKYYNVDLKPTPKFYPPNGGNKGPTYAIRLSAEAIMRLQKHFGIGSEEALKFSYAVQECIWVTEEGDYCQLPTLKKLARDCGLDEKVIDECVIDERDNPADPAVKEWEQYHAEAEQLGIFGTPNYVINGEIFWGQDRLHMVEIRIKELLAAGAKPKKY